MMWAVVDANASEGASGDSRNEEGVLANLPRTRPQRSSARRAAARAGAAPAKRPRKALDGKAPHAKRAGERTSARGPATETAKPPVAQKRRAPTPRRPPIVIEDPAPRQGFECEGETASGSIQPPGGAELVASAAEIFGELAKAGVSTGERLLKDVISRLPLS